MGVRRMTENKRFVCYFDNILKKWCVQNTDSLDMHYVADEPMGEEFAHLLNLYQQTLDKVEKENWQLKKQLQKIQDSFEVSWTQNYIEFDKDKLYIKDHNTEIRLDDRNLFIEVYIPQTDEYYRFRYIVTGRSNKMREFIKNYNSSGDDN